MGKYLVTKTRIREILQENKNPRIDEELEKWAEKVLTDILKELQEEQQSQFQMLSTKEDLRMVMEKMDERFEFLIKEMNLRFENVDMRFVSMQKEMNSRFESMQKEMNSRFESMQKEMNLRFQSADTKFEAMEKRLNTITWLIGMGFTIIAFMMGALNLFLRH